MLAIDAIQVPFVAIAALFLTLFVVEFVRGFVAAAENMGKSRPKRTEKVAQKTPTDGDWALWLAHEDLASMTGEPNPMPKPANLIPKEVARVWVRPLKRTKSGVR